jgi:RNA polymerase sigma factor (sigma-70 family)
VSDLEAAYRDLGPKLERWLARGTGSDELAADLVQDTFLRAVAAQRDLEPAWYWTVARHLLTDHWRAAGRVALLPLDLAADLEAPITPERVVLARLELAEVLDDLTVHQHAVAVLVAVGYSQPQIARRFGIARGTVASALHRTRERFRSAMP